MIDEGKCSYQSSCFVKKTTISAQKVTSSDKAMFRSESSLLKDDQMKNFDLDGWR